MVVDRTIIKYLEKSIRCVKPSFIYLKMDIASENILQSTVLKGR